MGREVNFFIFCTNDYSLLTKNECMGNNMGPHGGRTYNPPFSFHFASYCPKSSETLFKLPEIQFLYLFNEATNISSAYKNHASNFFVLIFIDE